MYKYIILKLNIFLANIESVIRAHFKTFQIKVAGNILFTHRAYTCTRSNPFRGKVSSFRENERLAFVVITNNSLSRIALACGTCSKNKLFLTQRAFIYTMHHNDISVITIWRQHIPTFQF